MARRNGGSAADRREPDRSSGSRQFLWRKKRPAEAGARTVDPCEAWGKTDEADAWRMIVESNSAARP
jgi:hypothetical protein